MSISIAVPSLSPIPDYSTLISVIADELDRDDLTATIPQFIQLAEAVLNRELRTPDMESSTLLNATSENVALPSDYLAMRSIYIEGSPDRPLRGMAPTAIRQQFDGSAGTPVAYTLVSGGLRLEPPPSSTIQLQLDYFARIEGLSDSSPSNWMLEKNPDVYLDASLYFAYKRLKNKDEERAYFERTAVGIGRINAAARADRYGAGPLIPNTINQVGQARA
jgi:hypothetical protein